jgi:SAM-dependent methyltransferase
VREFRPDFFFARFTLLCAVKHASVLRTERAGGSMANSDVLDKLPLRKGAKILGSCVSCGHGVRVSRRYHFKSDAFRKVYRDSYVYKCVACGLCQADVSKVHEAALLQYYRSEYRAVAQIGIGDPGHQWYRARAGALADLAAEQLIRSPARAFEVGAGYGYNLEALRERFPAALLFTDELDESIRLLEGINRASLSDGNYDVVILSHVLEHFTNPKQLISSAVQALAIDGIIVIEVPNDVPGIFSLNGPDEPHLTFFTAETLALLLGGTTVFGAGPPYRKRTFLARVRAFAVKLLSQGPFVSHLVKQRRRRVISPCSFAGRREDGIFLRAVVREQARASERTIV